MFGCKFSAELRLNLTVANTSCLTSEVTEVIKLSAANLTELVDLDLLNEWRLDRENTLYTYAVRHLAYSETLLCTVTRNTDNYASVLLDTLLVSFLNLVRNSDCITALECRKLFACCKSLFCDLH